MPACVVAYKSRIRISSNFFLLHLQNVTVDTDADRIRRGIEIRRPKKKRNSQNDMRIKSCIERYDNGAFSRLQFLKSISHSLGVHTEAFQVIGTLMLVTTSQSSTPPPPGSATLFQLAPLLECDDIPVTLMSALGASACDGTRLVGSRCMYIRLE